MRGNVSRLKSNFSYLKLDYLMPLQKIGHGPTVDASFRTGNICFNPSNLHLQAKKNLLAHYRHSPIFYGPKLLKDIIFGVSIRMHSCDAQASYENAYAAYAYFYTLINKFHIVQNSYIFFLENFLLGSNHDNNER